ncbi:hypothetical protein D3C86_1761070 [compost metagenome]
MPWRELLGAPVSRVRSASVSGSGAAATASMTCTARTTAGDVDFSDGAASSAGTL